MEPGLEATFVYDPPNFCWPSGTHVAVVEVDIETGAVELVRYVAVDDVGKVVNPAIVEGQMHGGLAQGVAQALYEEADLRRGRHPAHQLMTNYLVPTAADLPALGARPHRDAQPDQSARRQGRGRGGHDRRACGGDERRRRRALAEDGVTDIEMPATAEQCGAHRGGAALIPAPFDYERAESVEHALELLREREDAKLLAGGHSLLPLLRLRSARPSLLVDLGRLEQLSYVRDAGDMIAIGALTRHHDVAHAALLQAHNPLVSHAAGLIGDPQVRHRGTVGGSIAHGDPAARSAGRAARARRRAGHPWRGRRPHRRGARPLSRLQPDRAGPGSVLTEVRVPKLTGDHGWSYMKFRRRRQDWATVGVAAVALRRNGGVVDPALALVNMGTTPLRARAAEEAWAAGADAGAVAEEGTEPPSDVRASAEFRRHLARVLVRRAVEQAIGR